MAIEREFTAVRQREERTLPAKVCSGDAYGFFFWPFVLIANAFWIYIIPCFSIVFGRLYYLVCWPCLTCCCGKFTDKSFDSTSAVGTSDDFEWVRATELAEEGKKMKIYEGGVEPKDLCQGSVGDCWLVAALASAAEHPEAIQRAFLTPERNPRGKYRVRLYDGQKKLWVVVTIDDQIPCSKGDKAPLFMKAHGNEMWAILIEKAFAKFCGSYKALDGGHELWAWKALTGDPVFELEAKDKGATWARLDMVHKMDSKDKRACSFMSTSELYSADQAWVLIQKYIAADSLLSASGDDKSMGASGSKGLNGEAVEQAMGLVAGHAYSILDARELGLIPGLSLSGVLGKSKLIRLRNPWGTFEWKGAWSDGSKEWDQNPIVRIRLRPKDENDGSFWMPWEEFSKIFKSVQICDRSTSRDLRLNVNEDSGSCGVVLGCLGGLARFFCLCKGLRVIYCGHRATGQTRSAARGCCGLVGCWCCGGGTAPLQKV